MFAGRTREKEAAMIFHITQNLFIRPIWPEENRLLRHLPNDKMAYSILPRARSGRAPIAVLQIHIEHGTATYEISPLQPALLAAHERELGNALTQIATGLNCQNKKTYVIKAEEPAIICDFPKDLILLVA